MKECLEEKVEVQQNRIMHAIDWAGEKFMRRIKNNPKYIQESCVEHYKTMKKWQNAYALTGKEFHAINIADMFANNKCYAEAAGIYIALGDKEEARSLADTDAKFVEYARDSAEIYVMLKDKNNLIELTHNARDALKQSISHATEWFRSSDPSEFRYYLSEAQDFLDVLKYAYQHLAKSGVTWARETYQSDKKDLEDSIKDLKKSRRIELAKETGLEALDLLLLPVYALDKAFGDK